MELADVTDVPIRDELRYQFSGLWSPQITIASFLAPIWRGDAAPRPEAMDALAQRMGEFRSTNHRCNNCHTNGANFVDMASIGDDLDGALFYCSEMCANETERETHAL